MKLFKLKVQDNAAAEMAGYRMWTMAAGFVVLANSEKEARAIAAAEGHWDPGDDAPWWSDAKLTSCEEIAIDGQPRIILKDEPTG